jgi:flagellar basal-body rod modification protein FlgD
MSNYVDGIGLATTASSLSNGPSSAVAKDETSMGKEDFLTLLVAQLQNQDPLNPDDATEFTAQLAQFSSLEQLFTLNESMESLVASNATSDRLSTLSTIGKDVTYHGDKFKYEGNPVEIGYELDGAASDLTLTLQHNGATIATLDGTELTEGSHFITWDGLTEKGEPAPVGDYKILISAKAVDGESVGVAPLIKSEVTGVDMDGDSGGMLITQAGTVKFSDILGVYEPGTKLSTTIEAEEKEEESIEETLDTAVAVTESVAEIIE